MKSTNRQDAAAWNNFAAFVEQHGPSLESFVSQDASSLPQFAEEREAVDNIFEYQIYVDAEAPTAAGAAAVHIEDQVAQKRCGHRPNKAIVSIEEMVDRIKAAVDAKTDNDFVVMARTDALSVDGLNAVIDRAGAFAEAGADAIFAEAMTEIEMYTPIVETAGVPVLANLTEFGQTPLYHLDELASVGIAMALYPLSAFRAMNKAALNVYQVLKHQGSQASVVDTMQTRMELYDFLGYHAYENKLDELFADQANG